MDKSRFKQRSIDGWQPPSTTTPVTVVTQPSAVPSWDEVASQRPTFSAPQPVATPPRPMTQPRRIPSWDEVATPVAPPTFQPASYAPAESTAPPAAYAPEPTPAEPLEAPQPIEQPSASVAPQPATSPTPVISSGHKPRAMVVAAVGLLIVSAGLYGGFLYHKPSATAQYGAAVIDTDKDTTNIHVIGSNDPDFTPVVPKSKPMLAQAGKDGGVYSKALNTYAYTDTVNGQGISVSEEPVTSDPTSAGKVLAKIAQSYSATPAVLTNHGFAYIATDAKTNFQTVLFNMNNLLIIIQTSQGQPNSVWKDYVASLE